MPSGQLARQCLPLNSPHTPAPPHSAATRFSGLARKHITSASSATLGHESWSASGIAFRFAGVSMIDGAIAFTKIPSPATSFAQRHAQRRHRRLARGVRHHPASPAPARARGRAATFTIRPRPSPSSSSPAPPPGSTGRCSPAFISRACFAITPASSLIDRPHREPPRHVHARPQPAPPLRRLRIRTTPSPLSLAHRSIAGPHQHLPLPLVQPPLRLLSPMELRHRNLRTLAQQPLQPPRCPAPPSHPVTTTSPITEAIPSEPSDQPSTHAVPDTQETTMPLYEYVCEQDRRGDRAPPTHGRRRRPRRGPPQRGSLLHAQTLRPSPPARAPTPARYPSPLSGCPCGNPAGPCSPR
jgi:hypothetical protein